MSSNVVKMKRLESVKLKLPAHVRACLYHLFGIFVFVFISNNLFHTLCTGLLGTLINGLGFGTLVVVVDSRCGSGLSLWLGALMVPWQCGLWKSWRVVPINGGGMIEIHHCELERARGAGGSFPLHYSFGAEHMYRVRRTFDCFFETSLTSVNSQAQAGGVPLGCEGGLLGACLYPTIARRENAKVAALGGRPYRS